MLKGFLIAATRPAALEPSISQVHCKQDFSSHTRNLTLTLPACDMRSCLSLAGIHNELTKVFRKKSLANLEWLSFMNVSFCAFPPPSLPSQTNRVLTFFFLFCCVCVREWGKKRSTHSSHHVTINADVALS